MHVFSLGLWPSGHYLFWDSWQGHFVSLEKFKQMATELACRMKTSRGQNVQKIFFQTLNLNLLGKFEEAISSVPFLQTFSFCMIGSYYSVH